MPIQIDKNIPVPFHATKYPWMEMEVSDSFLLPAGKEKTAGSFATQANKRYAPRKFVVRKTEEGYRCWRIA